MEDINLGARVRQFRNMQGLCRDSSAVPAPLGEPWRRRGKGHFCNYTAIVLTDGSV